jgi:D-glucosaminate-6-phosphate ammonia-lyase
VGVYKELGVRTAINAAGTLTRLGGSRMAPEVLEAMAEASRSFVRIEDLQEGAGRFIAEVTGSEHGYVTSGAAAGLLLGTAACVAGMDLQKMERLPHTDTPGTKNEVVVHRVHRNSYDHAIRTVGVKLIEVGHFGHPGAGPMRPYELESAINERTAMVFWPVMGGLPERSHLSLEETVQIAHRHGVPVLVDAAGALPPPDGLRQFIAAGADLVSYSGGKALGGPQASGILAGRTDLIHSVALQHQDMDVHPQTWTWREMIADGRISGPPLQGIGRPCKVGREEVIGLIAAVRMYLKRDHQAWLVSKQGIVRRLAEGLEKLPGLTVNLEDGSKNWRPSVTVQLDEKALGKTAIEVVVALGDGDPIIAAGQGAVDQGRITFSVFSVDEGEEEIILNRMKEVLA